MKFNDSIHQSADRSQRKKGNTSSRSLTGRTTRYDAGGIILNDRDVFALRWIGQQYAIRLDQLQRLLGQRSGHGALHEGIISESAARDVVRRWKQGGWVCAERVRAATPMWIWLTPEGMKKVGLLYLYRGLDALNVHELEHLYAINEVRLDDGDLDDGDQWISERTLLQGMGRAKGREMIYRPDAVLYEDGDIIAIEVELSKKTVGLLSHILVSLICDEDYHGVDYHDLKVTVGVDKAQLYSQDAWRNYTHIYYYAPSGIRKYIRRVCRLLIEQGRLSEREVACISVFWYPLATTDEERRQEAREDDEDA